MYLPTHFKLENLDDLYQLIQDYPLASLMVVTDGEIEANHIPLELDRQIGEFGVLKGHIAKANPLASLLKQPLSAYVVFQAEQNYISPNWYEGKQEHHRVVPTWNYRVVHVKGQIKLMDYDQYLRGVLACLTRTHEESQENPWRMGDAPNDFIAEQLEKVAAIEIKISSIVGKFKVSQNRSEADIHNISKALQDSNPEMVASIQKYYPQ